MLSSVTTIRNVFILVAALVLATGCTTAKTLGTPTDAVAATPAPSSDTGTAEAAETAADTGTTDASSADTGTAETATDTGAAEAAETATDTGTAEVAEAATDTGTAEAAETAADTGTTDASSSDTAEAITPEAWTPSPLTLWVVHDGEHLWGISAHDKVYGDPYQWPLLFKRNRYQIKDADLIYPGQVLHIERDLSDAEIDRAIEHAKTRGAWILGITELTDLEYVSRERSYE